MHNPESQSNCGSSHGYRARKRLFQNWTFWGTPRYDDKPLRDHSYSDKQKTAAFNSVTEYVEVFAEDPNFDELIASATNLLDSQVQVRDDGNVEFFADDVERLRKALSR